jgi:hypothetical protein
VIGVIIAKSCVASKRQTAATWRKKFAKEKTASISLMGSWVLGTSAFGIITVGESVSM